LERFALGLFDLIIVVFAELLFERLSDQLRDKFVMLLDLLCDCEVPEPKIFLEIFVLI